MTPSPPQSPSQSPPPISPVGGGAEIVREQDKVMLVLSYLGLLCLIPLLSVKDSPYVTWHAKQGLTLSIVGALTFALGPTPLAVLNCLLWPALAVFAIMSMVKGLSGVRWRIPLIADLSEKF